MTPKDVAGAADPILAWAVELRGMVLTQGFDAMSVTLGKVTLHVTRDRCRIVVIGEGMRDVSLPSDEDVLASADVDFSERAVQRGVGTPAAGEASTDAVDPATGLPCEQSESGGER